MYAHNGHFEGGRLVDGGVIDGLRQLAATVVEVATRLPPESHGAHDPAIPRRRLSQI